jgi:3-deoxy-manno-octulosonate cytidylyltransferase (CMP-KDO synthetase)
MLDYAVIIPARYESTRLPGKPLIDLCGTPMIVRTYLQCAKTCPTQTIFVATDDIRIQEVCESRGINVMMTSESCMTGTDRVAECSDHIDTDVFINVQGDEPVFDPTDLTKLLKAIEQYPGEVLNGMCDIQFEEQFVSGSVPKVVARPDGRLLYMSRAGIPTTKKLEFSSARRQVCSYVFPRSALDAYRSVDTKSPLEDIEDIEILRFLELGWDVRMIQLSDQSIPVDLPEDVPRVVQAIQDRNL